MGIMDPNISKQHTAEDAKLKDKTRELELQMNEILSSTPDHTTEATRNRWLSLGPLTDAKIRHLSSLHGAEPVDMDETMEVRTW